MAAAALLVLPSVMGAGGLNALTYSLPANNSAVGGASVTFRATAQNATVVEFFYGVHATANLTKLCVGVNSTFGVWSCSADVSGISDKIYNTTVNATNGTTILSVNKQYVEFDSTAPSVVFSSTRENLRYQEALPYTCSGSDTYNSSLYSNITLKDSSGATIYTQGNMSNYELDGLYFVEYGEHNLTCNYKDAVNTGQKSIMIDVRQDGMRTSVVTTTAGLTTGRNTAFYFVLIGGFMLVMVVGVAVWIVMRKGGK